jgi:hypothetical protein
MKFGDVESGFVNVGEFSDVNDIVLFVNDDGSGERPNEFSFNVVDGDPSDVRSFDESAMSFVKYDVIEFVRVYRRISRFEFVTKSGVSGDDDGSGFESVKSVIGMSVRSVERENVCVW